MYLNCPTVKCGDCVSADKEKIVKRKQTGQNRSKCDRFCSILINGYYWELDNIFLEIEKFIM